LNPNHPVLSSGNIHLSKNKLQTPLFNDQTSNLPQTPYFNLQLFDDSDEFQSDDNDNTNGRHGTSSTKRTGDDDDDDDDDDDEDDDNNNNNNNNVSLRHTRYKSHSLDNLSTKSSVIMRRHVHPTRDVLTRRPALDPGGVHNLRNYVRHRKDSIVQRVIGYNYDDQSTAGGLYIRVGIGSN
jgi:hypothetical protein